jgi:hypothetical protein
LPTGRVPKASGRLAKPAPPEGSGSIGSLGAIVATLQEIPSPLTFDTVLTAILALLREVPPGLFPSGVVPGVEGFRQALETVIAWRGMNGDQLAAAMTEGVQSVAGYLERRVGGPAVDAATGVSALADGLHPDALRTPAAAVVAGLAALGTKVQGSDLTGAETDLTSITTAVTELGAALAALDASVAGAAGAVAATQLEALPRDLERRLLRALADLGGSDDSAPAPPPHALPKATDDVTAAAAAFSSGVATQLQRISGLLAAIDLSAMDEPLRHVVDTAKASVQGIDTAMLELTSTVSGLFDQLEIAIDSVDVASLTSEIGGVLQGLPTQVAGEVQTLFDPVKAALSDGISTIASAVSAIDLDDLRAALTAAVQSLADLAGSSDVGDALDEIGSVLQQGVDALQNLSFSPITDGVIQEINDVAEQLASIDPSDIPEPIQGALKAALSVLPDDFSHIADPLTSRFDELMQAGPLHVLEPVKGAPDRLKAELVNVSPSSVIGDRLSAPFDDLTHTLEGFTPSDTLTPVTDALDAVKARLQALDPSALLSPLSDAFGQIAKGLDRLDPAPLVKPVSDAIASAIEDLAAAIPIDAVFDPIDAVLSGIQRFVEAIEMARDTVQGIDRVLSALGSPQDEVSSLVDSLVETIGTIADTTGLDTAFTALRRTLDDLRGPALADRVGAPVGLLVDGLAALDPAALHAALVKARRDFPEDALKALPTTPERDQAIALVDGFDPMDPAFARPFQSLSDLGSRLSQVEGALATFFTQWEERFMGDSGPLSGFLVDDVTPAALQDLVRPGIQQLVAAPLSDVLELAGDLQTVAGGLAEALGAFLTDVRARLATLAKLPDALHAIRDSMNELLSGLNGLNPTFVVASLQTSFDHVKQQVRQLDPAPIAAATDAAFQQVVDGLSVDALLPKDAIQTLDEDYAKILDAVQVLDPRAIATELDPLFAQAIASIDVVLAELTASIDALTARLQDLGRELTDELNRCAEAFEQMLHAMPL